MSQRHNSTHPEFDPVAHSLDTAPLDDEPVTACEHDIILAGLEEAHLGQTITTEELRRKLGV